MFNSYSVVLHARHTGLGVRGLVRVAVKGGGAVEHKSAVGRDIVPKLNSRRALDGAVILRSSTQTILCLLVRHSIFRIPSVSSELLSCIVLVCQ